MSDTTTTATPAGPGTGEEAAIARIAGWMDSIDGVEEAPEAPKAKAKVAEPVEAEAEAEPTGPDDDGSEEIESPDEDDAPESEEPQEQSSFESLDDLAAALEVEPKALLTTKVKVKINGSEEAVTLGEALRGYQREQDYHRDKNQLAERRQAQDAAEKQAMQTLQAKSAEADRLIQTLEADLIGSSEEELNKLLEDDPYEYTRQKAQLDRKRSRLAEARYRVQAEQQAYQQQQAQQVTEYRRSQQQALLDKMPDLKDASKLSTFEREMTTYLGDLGIPDKQVNEFVNSPWSHQQILIIADAMKHRKWITAQKADIKKAAKPAPKTVKPGAARGNKDQDAFAKKRASIRNGKTTSERTRRAASLIADIV